MQCVRAFTYAKKRNKEQRKTENKFISFLPYTHSAAQREELKNKEKTSKKNRLKYKVSAFNLILFIIVHSRRSLEFI